MKNIYCRFLMLFVVIPFLMGIKVKSVQAATVYLENLPIIEKGQYDKNEGDSFVYPIGKHKYTRGNVGINGVRYLHGIEVWVARWNYTPEQSWTYSTFKLGKKYTQISGTALLIDSYNVTNFDTTLYFYGDNKLLRSYRMLPSNMPFKITLNVTGVDKLKIYAKDNGYFAGGTSFGLTNMVMSPTVNISKCSVESIGTKYYTGKAIKPNPKVKYKGKYLIKNTDYTLTYKNNVKPGTASVTIKGKGKYTGTKTIKFKIKQKPSISLSKQSITLSLAGTKTSTLKVSTKNTSGKVSWKSSNNGVVIVKDGKITAKGRGTAIITATVSGVSASCNVTVNDTSVKTVTYSFSTLDEWKNAVNKKERELVFGGNVNVTADGKTFYTGNIIVKRKINSYKKIKLKVSLNTPGYYKTIYLQLPSKVTYTLHRHNLKNDMSSSTIGKLIVGLMNQQVVWTQTCSCGFENVLTWDIPIPDQKKVEEGYTYTATSISRMID